MINAGSMGMPLHFGKMPRWLTERMGNMGSLIIESVVDNYGTSEVLTRMSDPNWFQAFGAVTGMHWNSSGVTAVLMGALKRKLNPKAHELGLYILGGKGKYSYYAPRQIQAVSNKHGLNGDELVTACKLTRRVDSNAVQDGFNLYQQFFLLTDEGECAGISQGMHTRSRRARRYHWHSPTVLSFVDNPHKGIFGIIQGGLFKDLRIKSLEQLEKINFDGYAIGGLAVGESQKEMFKVLDDISNFMPKDKPRYLMGVGTPSDIIGAVKRGVDMFDCVLPTRSGRTGLAFTWNGRINIRNSKYQNDNSPLDPKSVSYTHLTLPTKA